MTTLLTEQQQDGEIPVHASAMAFSPDGKLLASADRDGYVRLWNPATNVKTSPALTWGYIYFRWSREGRFGVMFARELGPIRTGLVKFGHARVIAA